MNNKTINKEVKLWIAMDENNKMITINKSEPKKDYICAECNEIVRARALNSEYMSAHYYHLNGSECSCEDAIHKYWKENFINIGDTIYLKGIGNITCIDRRIEFTFNTKEGIYKPDLVIKTDNKQYQFIVIEIYNTNAKDNTEYMYRWNELKYNVYELNVNGLNLNKSNYNQQLELIYNHKIEAMKKEFEEYTYKMRDNINSLEIIDNKYNNDIKSEQTKESKPFGKTIDIGIVTVEQRFKRMFEDDNDTIRKTTYYTYKGKNINSYQIYQLKRILESLQVLDIYLYSEIPAKLNNVIENIFKIKWDKLLYFDIIKPLNSKIKQLNDNISKLIK